jgi:two-component system OmpR family sensor kinase
MTDADTQADRIQAEPPEPPWRPREHKPLRAFRRLSDSTPLRTKLIAAVLVLVVAALAAISVTSVTVLRSYMTTQYDTLLQNAFAHVSAQDVAGDPPGFLIPIDGAPPELGIGIQVTGSPIQLVRNSGLGIVMGTGQTASPPSIPTTQSWANANAGKLITVGSTSGNDSWRVITEPVDFNGQVDTLVLAYDLGQVNPVITRLIIVELVVGAAIVVVLAAIGVGVVRANLRPLDDIEMTAGQIAKGHLNHRVPERDPRTEIGSLGRSLNAMLSQIETAFHAQERSEQAAHESEERMRRFIADASHELRTPLTTIRGFAEYYRQRGGVTGSAAAGSLAPADIDRIMKRLESEAARMGLLVEDLLQLARLDQQRPLDLAPVDLLTLAADSVQDARMVAPDRPVDLTVAPGAAFIVNGDEQRLRQVIGNLVNNALSHTPAGTPVHVRIGSGTLASGDPAVVLDVADEGPGMTPEQAQRVFERFYRADAARNRASGGTGLGLAIVAGLVNAHGGTVSVQTAPGEGADFQVKLPLSPDAQGMDPEDDDGELALRGSAAG